MSVTASVSSASARSVPVPGRGYFVTILRLFALAGAMRLLFAIRTAVVAPERPASVEASSVFELRRRSFAGDADASYELARRYEFGLGVPRDPEEAGERYMIAEEQGRTLEPRIVRSLLAGERGGPAADASGPGDAWYAAEAIPSEADRETRQEAGVVP